MTDTSNPDARRRRLTAEQSRTLILDAAERLLVREGYGVISSRRVAAEAGLKPPLVHYYYRTTDDLLLAIYRRATARSNVLLDEALAAERPLRRLWTMTCNAERTRLAAEFIALASHHEAIRIEMVANIAAAREKQMKLINQALVARQSEHMVIDPSVAAVLLATIGYGMVIENRIGVTIGHDAANAFVETIIESLEASPHEEDSQSA